MTGLMVSLVEQKNLTTSSSTISSMLLPIPPLLRIPLPLSRFPISRLVYPALPTPPTSRLSILSTAHDRTTTAHFVSSRLNTVNQSLFSLDSSTKPSPATWSTLSMHKRIRTSLKLSQSEAVQISPRHPLIETKRNYEVPPQMITK